MEELRKACLQCNQCGLYLTRTNVVFGIGPEAAPVLFIGEAPGQVEDSSGEPFVGPAGKFLDDMLSIVDLGRENCYITNTVKCRPPLNRDPLPGEQSACIHWLRKQAAIINPKIIVCLGRIAAQEIIRPDFKITKEHGNWSKRGAVWMTAIYHPSALLRDVTKRPDTFRDLKKIQEKIWEVCPELYEESVSNML